MSFAVLHTDPRSSARLGRLELPHGAVETPIFMPVGTQGSVKTLHPAELELLGSSAMRRTPLGLVVWSPFRSPKRAWLYDMKRWDVLAQWTAE